MSGRFRTAYALAAVAISLTLAGCFSSSSAPTAGGGKGGVDGKTTEAPGNGTKTAGGSSTDGWEGYPDVPYVPLMTEVDGITVPRLEQETQNLALKGKLPVDEGNEHAKKNPGKPATGDWLIVRFNSEPKTLNPIVETSAVQTYIGEYIHEALARLDPETLEYEPHIAEKWVAEDSVKLSPETKGKERRVALSGEKPATELEVDYPEAKKGDDPATLTFETSDLDGKLLGDVWVGLFPAEKLPGAPTNGYHQWSDASGKVEVSGIVPGKYKVRVGAEIFGETTKNEDGSLTVTPATDENPLHEELKSTGEKSLTLAKGEWTDVQEQTVYTYSLRDDVTWSDGTPFTTKDLEFGYAVINNPYVDGESLRVYYQDLVKFEPLDKLTARMKYRQQYFKSFEFTAGLAAYSPPFHLFSKYFEEDGKTLTLDRLSSDEEESQKKVSAHGQTFGKFFNTDDRYNLNPVGTGPYVFDKWVRADRVELRRNKDYWNKEQAPYLDRLIYKFIPDNVTAMQALKAGEIDFFFSMDAEQYFEDLKGPPEWFKDKYVKASWYTPAFGYVGWNMLKPKFQDRKVRLALALLFDREEFVDKKLHNEAVLVSGSQYYFGPAYDHTVKPLAYDLETARELLADAGWVDSDNDGVLDKNGEKFSFEFIYPPGNPIADARAALMQKSFKEAGIQMNVRQFEWASFIDKVKSKDYDVVTLSWASPLESDPFQIWHSSGADPEDRGSNHVSFSNKLADELIEQLRVTLDEEKRKRIAWSLHRVLDREQPYMFLYTPKDFGAYHKRFRGVKWYRVRPGFDFTRWYVPKDEQVHTEG